MGWLCTPPAGRPRRAMDPLGRLVSHLQADCAAHRVPDEDGLVNVEAVEDRQRRLGQAGMSRTLAALAAPVTGQVRNHVDPTRARRARSASGMPGDREPVEVDERDTVRVCCAVQ